MEKRLLLLFIMILTLGLTAKMKAQPFVFAKLNGEPTMNTNGWNLYGNAYVGQTIDTTNDEMIVCPNQGGSGGACFFNTPVYLNSCNNTWTAEFDYRLYDGDGADGLSFCFLNSLSGFDTNVEPSVTHGILGNTINNLGGGIGIPNAPLGIMVVLDTYNNCGPDSMPKLELRYGDGVDNYTECPGQPEVDGLDILEQPVYNHMKVMYNNGNISIYINDSLYLTGYYLTNFSGYFGFTASTGENYDNESVKNVVIYTSMPNIPLVQNLNLCPGNPGILVASNDSLLPGQQCGVTYAWSTGATSNSIVVDTMGQYCVTVTNCNGCSDTVCSTVSIITLPDVYLIADADTVNTCDQVYFYGPQSDSINTWKWEFGDGTVQYGSSSMSYYYSSPGIYTVTLVISNNCGYSDSTSIPITVLPNEVIAEITSSADTTAACAGIYLWDDFGYQYDISNYYWDFGDGNNESGYNLWEVNHFYSNPGNYNVMLIASNCYSSDTAYININVGQPDSINTDFTIYPDSATTCQQVNFYHQPNNNEADWYWDFGDGNGGYYEYDVDYSYPSPGTYYVTLYVIDYCGNYNASTQSITIIQGPPLTPEIAINNSDTVACSQIEFYDPIYFNGNTDNATEWYWDFGDGNYGYSDYGYTYHTYTSPGTYWVYLWEANCDSTADIYQEINVQPAIVETPYIDLYPGNNVNTCQDVTFYGNYPDGSISTWNWNFGDGSTSYYYNDYYQEHSYSNPGTYVVSLVITDYCGVSDSTSDTITVTGAAPSPDIEYYTEYTDSASTCEQVIFYDENYYEEDYNEGNNVNDWYWNFGDGSSETEYEYYTSHYYANPGTYNVELIAYNCFSSDTVYSTITINPAIQETPAISFYPGSTVDACQDVEFYGNYPDGTISNWSWDFGDGTVSEYNYYYTQTHLYSQAGTYAVKLVLTTNCGIKDSVVDSIHVNVAEPPQIALTVDTNELYACENLEFYDSNFEYYYYYGGDGATSWKWNFGDGSSEIAGDYYIYHVYSNPGTYTVQLVTTNCNSTDTVYLTLTVLPALDEQAIIGFDPGTTVSTCQTVYYYGNYPDGNISNWNWNFGDGGSAPYNNYYYEYHSYSNPGKYAVKLVITNFCGVKDSITDTVNVTVPAQPLIALSVNDTEISTCQQFYFFDYNYYYSNDNATSWDWNFGDGTSGNGYNVYHTYSNPGIYTVQLIATNCYTTDTTYQTVKVQASGSETATIAVYPDTTVSTCDEVQFYGNEPNDIITNWSWDFGDGSIAPEGNYYYQYHNYSNPGIYTVTLVITYNCGTTDTATTTITVNPIVMLSDISICSDATGTLTAQTGVNECVESYEWSTGDNSSSITVSSAGNYCVTVTNCNGCIDSACANVFVTPAPNVHVPNISICNDSTGVLTAETETIETASLGSVTGNTYNYLWANGDTTQSIIVSDSGQYCVTVNSTNECQSIACGNVSIIPCNNNCPPPEVSCSGDQEVCAGTEACFTGYITSDSITGYFWMDIAGHIFSYDIVLCTDSAATYYFEVYNSCGGNSYCTSTLTVDSLPVVSCSGSQEVCNGTQVCFSGTVVSGTNTDSNPIYADWYDSNYNFLSYGDELCLTASDTTAGTYYYAAQNGCGYDICSVTLTVDHVPVVSCSGDQSVCFGTEACFTGTLLSGTNPDYGWFDAAGNLLSSDAVNCTAEAGTYYFEAINGCGSDDCPVTLNVNTRPLLICPAPVVTCAGETPVFESGAEGTQPISYQWLHNGEATDLTNPNIGFYDVATSEAGKWTIVATNLCGSDTCNTSLTVDTVPVVICPQSQEVCAGSPVSFTASVQNNSAGPNTCATTTGWYQNGNLITNNLTLSFTSVSSDNAGDYYFVASDCCGADTCWVNLTVNTPPQVSCPGNQTVCAGDSLEVTAGLQTAGDRCPTHHGWYYNGGLITNSLTLSFANVAPNNAGVYWFKASNCCGSDSCSVNLTVNTPPQISCPQDQNVSAGANVQFIATYLSGTNTALCPTNYVWYFVNPATGEYVSVGSGLTLNLNSVNSTNAGQYCIVATNCCGSTTCCVNLTVNTTLQVSVNSDTICGNTTGVLRASTNSNCISGYLWSTGATGSSITVNAAGPYCVTVTDCYGSQATACGNVIILQAPVVTVNNALVCLNSKTTLTATTGDYCVNGYLWSTGATSKSIEVILPGTYCVTVTGCYGCKTVACGKVELDAPVVTCPSNLSVCAGNSATFLVGVTGGQGPFSFQWYKNCGGTQLLIAGATSAVYSIQSVTTSNECLYYCFVTGKCGGTRSCVASLTVNTPPVITRQPVSECTYDSTNATFSVAATNALHYQWQVNNSNLVGDTLSTLTLNTVTSSMCRNTYRVVVSNNCVSVISKAGTLTVIAAPGNLNSVPSYCSALLSWSLVCDVTVYEVEYWKNNSSHLTDYIIGTNVNLTGLTPGTKYFWHIRAYSINGCAATSGWSALQSFTTLTDNCNCHCRSIVSRFANNDNSLNLNLYPNPTTGLVNISLPYSEHNIALTIYDITGKKVYEAPELTCNTIKQIDMSEYSKGVYLVNVKNNDFNRTFKLVIQ